MIKYLNWLIEKEVHQQVMENSKYSPSTTWKGWLAGNYVGFSDSRIMVKSGHKLHGSYDPIFIKCSQRGKVQWNFKELYGAVRKISSLILNSGNKDTPQGILRKFCSLYPEFYVNPELKRVMKNHPGAFFRSSECGAMLGNIDRDVMLEIGAGAGVNPIINYFRFQSRNVIVDLPETISVAYLVVRTFAPDARILLPNEVDAMVGEEGSLEDLIKDYDFIFLLPTQLHRLPVGFASAACNVASFQEMDIEVVRNYVSFFHKSLRLGGVMVLLNLEVSRQIPGNTVHEYGLEQFATSEIVDAPFSNWQIRNLRGLRYVCCRARR